MKKKITVEMPVDGKRLKRVRPKKTKGHCHGLCNAYKMQGNHSLSLIMQAVLMHLSTRTITAISTSTILSISNYAKSDF